MLEPEMGPQRGIVVIHDGACPFCASYVRMVRLRQSVGLVDLVDARSGDPRVAALWAAGLDLDVGMVVLHGGQVFHGAAALRHLSVLAAPGGMANGVMRLIFRSPRRAAVLYPMMARGRRIVLRLLGRGTLAQARAEP